MTQNSSRVDFHIHSEYSSDGVLSPREVIELAKANNVSHIAIADHNTLAANVELWESVGAPLNAPMISIDGVNIISAVEVTCRVDDVLNKDGDTTKVHLLVYGADMSPNSPLVKLLKLKSKNDRDCDFGFLNYFLKQHKGHNITEQDIKDYISEKREKIPGYSSMSSTDVREFMFRHGITLATSNKQYRKLLKSAPHYNRLDISAKDLIDIAHASGGLVVGAHLSTNLKRTNDKLGLLTTLFTYGIDGIERLFNGSTPKGRKLFSRAVMLTKPENQIIYTAGSDTHNLTRGNTIGKWNITENILKKYFGGLIREIELLSKARKNGKITNRKYPKIHASDINDCLTEYSVTAQNLMYVPDGSVMGDD